MGNIYKDSKKERDDQEKKKEKEDFVSSRGRQTSKPVSYKA
jgi:hypothetical protein